VLEWRQRRHGASRLWYLVLSLDDLGPTVLQRLEGMQSAGDFDTCYAEQVDE